MRLTSCQAFLRCAISIGICLFAHGSQARNLQGNDAPAFCDSIETDGSFTICVISTDHSWASGNVVSITPDSVRVGDDPDRPQLPSEPVNAIRVAQNTVLENRVYLGELSISGFESVIIDGTLRAPKVAVQSEGNIALQSSASFIDTSGQGYASRSGAGKGFLYKGNDQHCLGDDKRVTGASHLGRGGSYCGDGRPSTAYDPAGNDFGSGGASYCGGQTSQGGGIVSLSAATTITIAETAVISADAAPQSFCSGLCSGGSGGSIHLAAPGIFGAGQITASGGDARTGGGGGYIRITADDFKRTDFIVKVSGGGTSKSCTEAGGEAGKVDILCLTSVCGAHGTKLPNDQCGCECDALWSGNDCSICTQSCFNGGTVIASSCTCDCPLKWKGEQCQTCDSDVACNGNGRCSIFQTGGTSDIRCTCDPNWYGSSCSTFCNRDSSCTSNGVCSQDGSQCICNQGKIGTNCFCDACSASNSACSARGTCNGGECSCNPGWSGCSCEIPCDCSGNGSCNLDGTCVCDPGFAGPNCDVECEDCNGNGQCNEFDGTCTCNEGFTGSNCLPTPERYCAGKAATAVPCLPGILKAIGFGWDRLRGSLTPHRLISLTFTQKTQVFFGGKTYEIPDQVTVEPIDVVSNSFDTFGFLKTRDLREYLATSTDFSGVYKGVEMGLSSEYTRLVQKSFKQERTLYISTADYQLYNVKLDESLLDENLSAKAFEVKERFEGDDRLIPNLGTDYVKSVTLGGRVRVDYFVDLDVVAELSSSEILTEANAAAQDVTYAPEFDGSVESVVENKKSCFARRATFKKTITGGDKDLSFVQSLATGLKGLGPWRSSVAEDPGMLKVTVNSLEYIFPDLNEEIAAYLGSVEGTTNDGALEEIDLNERLKNIDGSNVCDDPFETSDSALEQPTWLQYVIPAVICLLVLVCLWWCCCKRNTN